jgi:hypothetical protein
MIQVYKGAFKARAMSLRARRVADFFFWFDLKMQVEITPECLSREELVHELTVGDTVVSDADPVEKLAFNLKVFLSMERNGILR